jgi:hypothetical protein
LEETGTNELKVNILNSKMMDCTYSKTEMKLHSRWGTESEEIIKQLDMLVLDQECFISYISYVSTGNTPTLYNNHYRVTRSLSYFC